MARGKSPVNAPRPHLRRVRHLWEAHCNTDLCRWHSRRYIDRLGASMALTEHIDLQHRGPEWQRQRALLADQAALFEVS